MSRVTQRYFSLACLGVVVIWLLATRPSSLSDAIDKLLPGLSVPQTKYGHAPQNAQQRMIRDVTRATWAAYRKNGWPHDMYRPLSLEGGDFGDIPMGYMIVDSIDTLMLMGLDDYVDEARGWIAKDLHFDIDTSVSVFETTIRMIGGLLAAYHLSGNDQMYLNKACDLADRIVPAFSSKTGIPYANVNLMRGMLDEERSLSTTAEVATLQLEFRYLAQLTENEIYWRLSEHVMDALHALKPPSGLAPIGIEPEEGAWATPEIRMGSRGDSYYEYLLKQWLQTRQTESPYREWYDETVDGIVEYLVAYSKPNNRLFIGERPGGIHRPMYKKMDHLVCFAGAMFALGATNGSSIADAKRQGWTKRQARDFKLGEELTETCVHMYLDTPVGLSPEIVMFNTDDDAKTDFWIKQTDTHNLQRPETVESLFVLYRLTGDQKYRRWGWKIFQNFVKATYVSKDAGYASLKNVLDPKGPKIDNMETFWIAETLKYLYLLFDDSNTWPLDKYVLNTEAHPLPIFEPKFQLGWQRG